MDNIDAIFAEAAAVSSSMMTAFDAIQDGISRKEQLRKALSTLPSSVAGMTLGEACDQASLWDMSRAGESQEAYDRRMKMKPLGTQADFDTYQQLMTRLDETFGRAYHGVQF